jgi:hypothetical protein
MIRSGGSPGFQYWPTPRVLATCLVTAWKTEWLSCIFLCSIISGNLKLTCGRRLRGSFEWSHHSFFSDLVAAGTCKPQAKKTVISCKDWGEKELVFSVFLIITQSLSDSSPSMAQMRQEIWITDFIKRNWKRYLTTCESSCSTNLTGGDWRCRKDKG